MNLEHQHLLVVGGSSGIGLAVARQALAAGMRVTIAGRSDERLQQAVAELPGAQMLVLDVENADAVAASIALAVWLGAHVHQKPSDWDH